MSLEAEGQQVTQGGTMFVGHDPFGCLEEIVVDTGHQGVGVGIQSLLRGEGIPACEVEQGVAVVEQRRRCHDLVGFVVHQEAKVSEMPVGVADHGVKDQHIVEGLDKLLALALIG